VVILLSHWLPRLDFRTKPELFHPWNVSEYGLRLLNSLFAIGQNILPVFLRFLADTHRFVLPTQGIHKTQDPGSFCIVGERAQVRDLGTLNLNIWAYSNLYSKLGLVFMLKNLIKKSLPPFFKYYLVISLQELSLIHAGTVRYMAYSNSCFDLPYPVTPAWKSLNICRTRGVI
jgi:hypothetical protein